MKRDPNRLTEHEREVAKLLRHPGLWGHAYLRNRDGSLRVYWPHQFEDLICGSRNIIHLDGRDVGKTVCLTTDVMHYAFTTRGGTGLIAAPHQGHLDTIIDEIEYQIGWNPDLERSIAKNTRGLPKIVRKPYFKIEWTNGSVLHFRPAGAYGEAFRSLHVDRLWVDEGAWIPDRAWKALRQCVNAGGRIRIYSTPNGVRNSTYYRLTQSPGWRVFHWPSWLNPIWSPEREAELTEFYGGKDSPGWQHEVAGEHGAPTFGVFNIERFNLCRRQLSDYRCVTIPGEALADCGSEAAIRERLDGLLNLAPLEGVFWVGGDLGYSQDPTEITVWREEDAVFHSGNIVTKADIPHESQIVETRKVMRLVLRVRLEHVAYPIIAECLACIDRYYKAQGLGVDNGGNGGSVVQELLTLDKYRPQLFPSRLHGIDFGGTSVLGFQDNGEPLKKPTKEYMTQLLVGAFQNLTILLPAQDPDLEAEFITHTYTLANGRVTYSKGHDHIIDSARCAFLVRDRVLHPAGRTIIPKNLPMPMATDPIF